MTLSAIHPGMSRTESVMRTSGGLSVSSGGSVEIGMPEQSQDYVCYDFISVKRKGNFSGYGCMRVLPAQPSPFFL